MAPDQPRLLIRNGTLIDGSGRDPVPNTLIVVEGKRIAHVGRPDGGTRPECPEDRLFDAAGKYILPGLIDAHCHISLHQGALPGVKYTSSAEFCTLWAAHAIGRVLRAGVTSIAVPGGKWFTDVTVREAVAGGLLEGPRMVVAGRALSNYGSIFDPDPYPAWDGQPERRIRHREQECKRGVDLIKIAIIRRSADRRRRRNRGRCRRGPSAQRQGRDPFARLDLDPGSGQGPDRPDLPRRFGERGSLDVVARAGMPIAPVLTAPWIGVEHDIGRAAGGPSTDRLRAQLDQSFQMIRNARDRGIPVLSGSDTGNASAFHHGRWHGKEAELFVKEVGMTPVEAIAANTSHNAGLLGLAGELGVVAPGMLADIVIWNHDPLADITVLQRPDEIALIVKDGRVVNRDALGFLPLAEEPQRAPMHG